MERGWGLRSKDDCEDGEGGEGGRKRLSLIMPAHRKWMGPGTAGGLLLHEGIKRRVDSGDGV